MFIQNCEAKIFIYMHPNIKNKLEFNILKIVCFWSKNLHFSLSMVYEEHDSLIISVFIPSTKRWGYTHLVIQFSTYRNIALGILVILTESTIIKLERSN